MLVRTWLWGSIIWPDRPALDMTDTVIGCQAGWMGHRDAHCLPRVFQCTCVCMIQHHAFSMVLELFNLSDLQICF